MENFSSNLDLENLVKELAQGRELAMQLQIHLNAQSTTHEMSEFLLRKILNSYDHALSMINYTRATIASGDAPPPAAAAAMTDSPQSLTGSPRSDDSDQEVKDQASRKRKGVPRWTQKVTMCAGPGAIVGQLDDGHGWRKYGQKDILGAKYPRGYYRCTFRHGQGCLATKQVQRSDDDPTTYEITYRGMHTCSGIGGNSSNKPPILMTGSQNNQEPIDCQTSLGVMTQDLDPNKTPSIQPFNFPSASSTCSGNNNIFSEFMGNYPADIISPATSGSNYFAISPSVTNYNYDGVLFNDLQITESELNRVVSAATTSATTSSTLGMDFPFGASEFDPNFGFGNARYFP